MDGSDEPGIQPWRSLYAEALIGAGRLQEAEAIIAALTERATDAAHPSELVRAARLHGLLLVAQRSLAEAAVVLEAGRQYDPEDRSPLEHALIEILHGSVLRRLGKRRAALSVLNAAADRLTALDARPFLERCQREQAACGLTPRARQTSAVARLTPQERTVATLVASGMSNKEVAEELVLSVKTIEYHLGNVFTKLQVTSRGRLAAKIAVGT